MCVCVCVCLFVVLSKLDLIALQEGAERFSDRLSPCGVAECQYLYRTKSMKYFNTLFRKRGGIMRTYLKDASGDLRSPINGEISGLFFCANVNQHGQPFPYSPFGDRRILICVEEILRLTPNMFFADFYCMGNNQNRHNVTIVLTKTGSSADLFCKQHLPRLDINSNPFLYKEEDGGIWVSSVIFVEIFVTEDLDINNMLLRHVAGMRGVEVHGILGKTSQGGQAGIKSNKCKHCDIFCDRFLAKRLCGFEEY